jgi:outer membrane immunogenic protein
MRRLTLAVLAIAAAGCAQIASAADVPVKAPVYKAPVAVVISPNWTGFYVGIAGGYGWGKAEQSDSFPFNSGTYNTSGGLIGGTLGYNWQSGATVFGVETDLSYADIKGSTIGTDPASGNCAVPANPNCESTIRALGTARGRLGLAWQNLLPYVTGGLAYANLHGAEGVTGTGGSGSKWVPGWTIGAGLEGILAPNWSVKAEYLYVDLGRHEVFTDVFGGVPTPESLRETAHIVRVGVNYRFGYR